MISKGRMFFAREVIDLGAGYDPSGTMNFKVYMHYEEGEQRWSSSRDQVRTFFHNAVKILRQWPS